MRNLLVFAICGVVSLAAQPVSPVRSAPVRVPFVGCPSDGQLGPLTAPVGESKELPVSPEIAREVAFYRAEQGAGVLAPRGWYCFGTYGSNGESLYVSPEPIDPANLLSPRWSGFRGPVVQISHAIGDTSGRFEVARITARVFPAHRDFARRVVAEGIEPANNFPLEPYPHDKLIYRSQELVEYQTPAENQGLGTHSRLLQNSSPISGVAILTGPTPDLVFLALRLPANLPSLAPEIIREVELESARAVTSPGSTARVPSPAPENH